jgi:hypothetical protein
VQASSHEFGPLPAGPYELFAQAPLERQPGIQGHYDRVNVGQDRALPRIVLRQVPPVQFTFEGASAQAADSIQVLARRKDLAGEGATEVLKLANNAVQLAPGPWEIAPAPIPGFYVSGFSGSGYQRRGDGRFDGWNEINVGSSNAGVKFTLSSSSSALHGTVKSGSEPVAGAPVFLEPMDLEPRRRVTDTFSTRTDMRGHYQFSGLAPGNYRVLSSFEYQMPDSQTMSNASAKTVQLDSTHEGQQDLDLYIIR